MMKKRIAIAWFLLLSTGLINAQEKILSKAHFQYQAEISIDSPKSLQMLRLPEAIQSKLYSRNAQDIRVFNSDGLMLPSLIRYQGKDEGKTAVPPVSKTLSFYPIPGVLPKNHKEDPPNTSANEKSPDVKSLEVKLELKMYTDNNPHSQILQEANKNPSAYIIEIPNHTNQRPDGIKQLILKWKPDFEGIATLKLETSSDLNQWQTLIETESLVNMRYKQQQLEKNTLAITTKTKRFLKLSWTGQQRPMITDIKAEYGQQTIKPAYKWSDKLILVPVTDENIAKNTFDFSVSPSFKSNKFRLANTATNQVYTGTLSTRRHAKLRWDKQSDFQFYQIALQDDKLSKLEKNINTQLSRNWRIHFQYPNPLNHQIAVQVNRYPVDLYFLTQGNGPFYLAYGNNAMPAQAKNLSQVVSDVLRQTQSDYAIPKLSHINTPIDTIVSKKSPLDWKKIILWAVLVSGVLLMLWMAKGLFRQISNETNTDI